MGDRGIVVGPVGARDFFTYQPCGEVSTGCFLCDKNSWGLKLTTQLHLGLRVRISVSILSLPHMLSWHVQRLIYFYICVLFYRRKDPLFLDKKLLKKKQTKCLCLCNLKAFQLLKLYSVSDT
jgi:hypothetical protein